MRSAALLRIGEKAIIREFSDAEMSLKLLEMGCLPGTEICLNWIAPLGDPVGIQVGDYCLSLRKEEAATIVID
ncbi:MAG: FeoA family protein [Spirosomataceae bacterium]